LDSKNIINSYQRISWLKT